MIGGRDQGQVVPISVRIVSALAGPDLADQADEATADAFPEYNTHGDVASPAGRGCTRNTRPTSWSRGTTSIPAGQRQFSGPART
jgi:hypothetical protein